MFGYVRPHTPELKVKEYALYRSIYCGICRSMKKKTGCTSCLALSYDSVLLALARMTVEQEEYTVKARRCLVHPLRKREMLEPCQATYYAATAQMTLLYHQVKDHRKDDRGFAKLGAWMLSPFSRHWYKRAKTDPQLGEAIATAMEAQEKLEQEQCDSPDMAAEPTGQMMAEVFSFGLADPAAKRILYQFGYHLGRCIYFMDAADDYEKDQKRHRYNPFLLAGEAPKENLRLRTAMRLELDRAATAWALLPIYDAGVCAITENILYWGLPKRIDALLQLPSDYEEKKNDLQTKEAPTALSDADGKV